MSSLARLPLGLRTIRKLALPRKLGLLEAIYGRRLANAGIDWVECCNGTSWKLDLGDPTHRWIVFGDYEGGVGIEFARKTLSTGGVFVDSGANIGQWILYLGSLPGVQALEFEPVKSQRAWLEECVVRQPGWNCKILPCGLGSRESIMQIQCHGSRSTLRTDWYTTMDFPKESIAIRRLDDVLSEEQIPVVRFWKLDVEGAEYDALLGAENYLKTRKIQTICFECHPTNYIKNREILEDFGYQVFDLDRQGLTQKLDREIDHTQDLVAMPTT